MPKPPFIVIPHASRDEAKLPAPVAFIHCAQCLEEVKVKAKLEGSASPRDHARFEVCFADDAERFLLQVWCVRHDCNVGTFEVREPTPDELADD